jgi:hypothetical protein
MADREADSFAQAAANRVREIVGSAEERAEEILSEAREEAERIREHAEAEAREKLDEVRAALADLEGRIGAGAAHEPSATPEPEVRADQTAAEAEEAPPALQEEPAETSGAPTEKLIEQLRSGAGEEGESDAGAARLVAMKMALDGASRDEIDRHLAESYKVPDRRKLVDEVLAKASR